jgi:hypothetical protein
MTFRVSTRTVQRVQVLLASGLLTACISLASTLPGPAHKSGEDMGSNESMLPRMMDSSASYTETARPEEPESTPLHARIASGDTLPAASPDSGNGSQGQSCVPEPMSLLLMAGGLFGLISARRFQKVS